MEADAEPLLEAGQRVWLRADSADWSRERGWEYSISVTGPRKKAPVLRTLEEMALADGVGRRWTRRGGSKRCWCIALNGRRRYRWNRGSGEAVWTHWRLAGRTAVVGGTAVKQAWRVISFIG